MAEGKQKQLFSGKDTRVHMFWTSANDLHDHTESINLFHMPCTHLWHISDRSPV